MQEGWCGDDYLILFEEDAERLRVDYGLATALSDHRLVGLRAWDDFIVENDRGARFTVPTVPIDRASLARYTMPGASLVPDERFRGRIKWYVKPIVFGGSPDVGPNLTWLPLDEHAKAVVWWNEKYREVRGSTR